jgi:hypothetical protein
MTKAIKINVGKYAYLSKKDRAKKIRNANKKACKAF